MIDPLSKPAMPPNGYASANDGKPCVPSFMDALSLPSDQASPDAAVGREARFGQSQSPLPERLPSTEVSFPATPAEDADEAHVAIFELRFRDQKGGHEIVTLPWRLTANGHLAQTSAELIAALPLAGPDNHAIAAEPITSLNVTSERIVLGSTFAQASLTDGGMPAPATDAPSPPQAMTLAHDMETADASSSSVVYPVAMQWMARWMKWIERDGHGASFWLRDYRIGNDESRRVVDTMRAFARENGLALERVVVNGRELWCAHQSYSSKE